MMPYPRSKRFAVLKVEVTRLHYRWKVLKQLYSETRRVELLNTVASGFFGLDQAIWEDAIVLGIARVLDPNRDATSVRQLVRLASTKGRHDVLTELEKRLGNRRRSPGRSLEGSCASAGCPIGP